MPKTVPWAPGAAIYLTTWFEVRHWLLADWPRMGLVLLAVGGALAVRWLSD